MKRLYSLFEKQGAKWVRISCLAVEKPGCYEVFQDALLGCALGAMLERKLKAVHGEVYAGYQQNILNNRARGVELAKLGPKASITDTDYRVKAIRRHPLVGRGSCSRVDECYSDDELAQMLNHENIIAANAAMEWALDDQEMFLERGLDQRWGEDDDSQLIAYTTFKDARAAELKG